MAGYRCGAEGERRLCERLGLLLRERPRRRGAARNRDGAVRPVGPAGARCRGRVQGTPAGGGGTVPPHPRCPRPGIPALLQQLRHRPLPSLVPVQGFPRHCDGAAPQVYWNAFRWPVEQSLGWMYQDYATLGIPPERIFPVGGLYQEGTTRLSEAGRSARLRAEDDSARLARGQLLVLRAHERRDVAGGRFGGDRRGEGGRYVKRRVRAGRRMDLSAVGPARAGPGANKNAAFTP